MNAKEIVSAHLRAIEAGDWDLAQSYIADEYSMTGTIPFPVSLFVKIGSAGALRMHKARRRALPDFKFNESVLEESADHVNLQINLTGTHTGVIDYTGILRGVPVITPTGRRVALNPEYFTYWVEANRIVRTAGKIPKDAGVQGLVRAVS